MGSVLYKYVDVTRFGMHMGGLAVLISMGICKLLQLYLATST